MAKGLAVGLQKGYVVSKIEVSSKVKKVPKCIRNLICSEKESKSN